MLETLERENLFVVPLDEERRWYRYHHLFADALRARLAARHAGRVADLHAPASRWLAENGLLADAVRHAIASGDHEHTADLNRHRWYTATAALLQAMVWPMNLPRRVGLYAEYRLPGG